VIENRMKPIDLRNAAFEALRTGLQGKLQAAYYVWLAFGPGTTRDVAIKSGWDILSLRPRTTDLFHLGLVELCGKSASAPEGLYRARNQQEWQTWVDRLKIKADQIQLL
jgi:hypothetical protein